MFSTVLQVSVSGLFVWLVIRGHLSGHRIRIVEWFRLEGL